MRIAGLVAAGDGDWRQARVASANDVIMRIAGLVPADTGRRYGDWRHVATG